jgi:uncharacterized protein involved in outer membrane biogenesis
MLTKLLIIAGIIASAFIVLLIALAVIGLPINLDFIKPDLEKIVQKNIGRKVVFTGTISLRVSLWPSLTMENVHITNPNGFAGSFAKAGLMQVRVDLLPLFNGQLILDRLAAKQIVVNLLENKAGKKNWIIDLPKRERGQSKGEIEASEGMTLRLKEFRDLSLEDIEITYSYRSQQPITYKLKSLSASGSETDPLKLHAKGEIEGTPFSIAYQAALGRESKGEAKIRKSRWASHELSSKMELTVGQSHFKGKAHLWETNKILGLQAELVSSKLQINDFITPAYLKKSGKNEPGPAKINTDHSATTKDGNEVKAPKAKLEALLGAIMRNSDLDISIRADQVLSGKDELGGGALSLKIKDGHLALKPAEVRVPGGKIQFGLELDARGNSFDAQLGVLARNFDLGVLVKRIKPETKAGGILNLNVLLQSRTSELDNLLPNASGHFYFAVQPENVPADMFDLWAVNLLTAILPRIDKDAKSHINCLVGRMKLKDGVTTDEIIMMDTTRMIVEGKGEIDFKEQRAEFVFKPRAKRPEFFAAATPVRASGPFKDFKVDVTNFDLVVSLFSMATSPLHVPVRRVFSESTSPDGKEACTKAMNLAISDTYNESTPIKKYKEEPALANE